LIKIFFKFINNINYNKNNNIYNTNNNIFNIKTIKYNKNNNIYNTNNNIFILIFLIIIKITIFITQIIIFRNLKPINVGTWRRTQENWVLTQDPLLLGPDAGPINLEYWSRTQDNWVLIQVPRKLSRDAGPNSLRSWRHTQENWVLTQQLGWGVPAAGFLGLERDVWPKLTTIMIDFTFKIKSMFFLYINNIYFNFNNINELNNINNNI